MIRSISSSEIYAERNGENQWWMQAIDSEQNVGEK